MPSTERQAEIEELGVAADYLYDGGFPYAAQTLRRLSRMLGDERQHVTGAVCIGGPMAGERNSIGQSYFTTSHESTEHTYNRHRFGGVSRDGLDLFISQDLTRMDALRELAAYYSVAPKPITWPSETGELGGFIVPRELANRIRNVTYQRGETVSVPPVPRPEDAELCSDD